MALNAFQKYAQNNGYIVNQTGDGVQILSEDGGKLNPTQLAVLRAQFQEGHQFANPEIYGTAGEPLAGGAINAGDVSIPVPGASSPSVTIDGQNYLRGAQFTPENYQKAIDMGIATPDDFINDPVYGRAISGDAQDRMYLMNNDESFLDKYGAAIAMAAMGGVIAAGAGAGAAGAGEGGAATGLGDIGSWIPSAAEAGSTPVAAGFAPGTASAQILGGGGLGGGIDFLAANDAAMAGQGGFDFLAANDAAVAGGTGAGGGSGLGIPALQNITNLSGSLGPSLGSMGAGALDFGSASLGGLDAALGTVGSGATSLGGSLGSTPPVGGTGGATGGTPTGGAGVPSTTSTTGATSGLGAVQQFLKDYGSVLGPLISGGLGYYGQQQQTDALNQLGQQYFNIGAPYRGMLEQSYQPGFDLFQQGTPYGSALQRAADVSARAANAQFGNATDPAAQYSVLSDVTRDVTLPTLATYRGQLGQFGGLGLNTSGAISGQGASLAGSQYAPVAGAIGQMFQPQDMYTQLGKAILGGYKLA